ncbi:choice-of-anchor A family protein, partial [Flavobacterium tructae]
MLNKITLKLRQLQLTFILCFLSLFSGWNVFAEGSKDLFPSGATGYRMLMSSTNNSINTTNTWGVANRGKMYVYANAGEVLYLGSSAQGKTGSGVGRIILTAPNGTSYNSGTSTTVGLISSRAQELNGPSALVGAGGYNAYSRTVGASESGIWIVEFLSDSPNLAPSPMPGGNANIQANSNWTQATNTCYIVAWDVTVAASGVAKSGRVYANVLTGHLGDATNQWNSNLKVLTYDGFQYNIQTNGVRPVYFNFFVNNKGLRSGVSNSAAPVYTSSPLARVNNYSSSATDYSFHNPTDSDDLTNFTHKIFYNTPDPSMPAEANIYNGSASTTWLNKPIITQTISNVNLRGVEGSSSGMGTAPLGGFVTFDANTNANYTIEIDVNNNNSMADPVDRILRGTAVAGSNSVRWDGKDNQGNSIPYGAKVKVAVILFNGEVHFPYIDAEDNPQGIIITRVNGSNPNSNIYWNDSIITGDSGGVAPSPVDASSRTLNTSSASGAHRWSGGYGNLGLIDTWSYVYTTPPTPTEFSVIQNAADLAVTSISDVVSGNVGSNVTYTVVVKNIGGPNDVTGAKFKFSDLALGANLAVQSFTSSSTLGGAITAQTITGGVLDATVDLPKDATVTFTIVVKVLAAGGSNPIVKATIMRPADLTDPDATADTHIGTPPVDPDVECDGTPSGVGCNNAKTDALTVIDPLPFPSATNSCLGVFLSDVISSNPPTSIYKPATFTGDFIGRDNAINFAVGGNLTITNGAEYEGRSFVYGNFTMNKTSAFNLGVAGVGSFIVPDDNKNILTIGGNFDASAASGNLILGGESGNGQKSYGTIVYKGTKSPNVKITGDAAKVINEATLDLAPYNDAFNALQVSSTAWNQLPSDPNVTFANDGFGTYTFTCLTPAVSKSYVINIPNVLASRPNGTINFVGFPDTASLLINVPGTTTNFNIATFQFNGVTQAVGSGNKAPANEVAPFSLRILWNLPTATTVSLKGAQFWGSMVIPQRTGTVTNEMIGMNGRFIVGGNLIQNIGGSETHNYPFKGEISTTDAPVVTTPVNYCQDETATALTATGSNLKWYTAQTGGVGSATAPTPVTTAVGTTTYYVSQTVGNCESARTAIDVVVKERPVKPTAGTVTQPTCSVATGSFAISNYNAAYTYSVNPSTGVTVSGATVTAPAGTYTVTATLGTCSSVVSDNVVINAQPSTPVKPTAGTVTQPNCSVATGSFAISNYNAAYTYSVNPSTGVTVSGATVTAPAGTYTVTATLGTCSSVVSDNVVINAQPTTPVKPIAGTVTQPTCSVATGSFAISNYNAAYTYSVNPSTGVTISGATVTAPAGTYTVTATLGTCSSVVSDNVVINAQPSTPVKPTAGTVTQPTCSVATGSFAISNYNAAYTYSVNPSTGVTVSGATVTAPAGTYTVTATLGTCSSVVSDNVVINAQPSTPVKPTAGTVTQPTCSVATGSFAISNYNAAYTYSVNPSTGVTVSGATVTAPAGTYTVTATLGTCSSVVSDNVVINAQPTTPVKPTAGTVTQPTCSVATGSFTISNYNAAYTYSVNPSTGVTVSGATVTAPAGTYTVTATLGTCSSVVSDNVVINAQPTTPVKPTAGTVTQPTCSVAKGSFAISNYNAAYTYSVNPSTGVTVSGATVTAPAGTYTVTATLGTCSSVVSDNVVINAQPTTPVKPTAG